MVSTEGEPYNETNSPDRGNRVTRIRLKVKDVITQKHITQSKLSRVADVPLNTIQMLYHHPYHDPKLSTLYRLAKALGVTVNDLYEVVEEEE